MALLDFQFNIPKGEPQRLDDFLQIKLSSEVSLQSFGLNFSKAKIRRLIMARAVLVKGRTEKTPSLLLNPGTLVKVRLDPEKFIAEKDPGDVAYEVKPEDILFQDQWILVVNKPAGIPTEGTVVSTRDSLHGSLLRFLRSTGTDLPYLGLHHRLDKETSGVILFTKVKTANAPVHQMFLLHQVQKTYVALTVTPPKKTFPKGLRPGDSWSIKDQLGRISPKSAPGKWGKVPQGDRAQTDFTLLKLGPRGALVEARPLTGRTHQIRVHLAGCGMALWGDTLYGGPRTVGVKEVPRVMLHARVLRFPHPQTGEVMEVEAPMPRDFMECVGYVGKI